MLYINYKCYKQRSNHLLFPHRRWQNYQPWRPCWRWALAETECEWSWLSWGLTHFSVEGFTRLPTSRMTHPVLQGESGVQHREPGDRASHGLVSITLYWEEWTECSVISVHNYSICWCWEGDLFYNIPHYRENVMAWNCANDRKNTLRNTSYWCMYVWSGQRGHESYLNFCIAPS